MKIESRGKYPGVKVHLDPDECELLLQLKKDQEIAKIELKGPLALVLKMGVKIAVLQEEEPGLLQERTQEQILAILAKESEKAALQLEALKKKGSFKEIDPDQLQAALLKHVK